MIIRRNFLVGLFTGLIAAPAIVRASSLMPVRTMDLITTEITRVYSIGTGVPRCNLCFRAFGMCSHTGGPLTASLLVDQQLDQRVLDTMGGLPARWGKVVV